MTSALTASTIIPKPRVLVLCFDGTSNQYSSDNTNVVQFYSLLNKEHTAEQITYYQAGIGTYLNPGVVSPMFQWGAKVLDLAIACFLDAHVRDGYRFLMRNYKPGDKICLFGFSRGSYTVRALAGLLYKIGLLPRDNEEQIPFAYKLYKRTDDEGVRLAAGFKATFCRAVIVDYVGVWDTVASVGVVYGRNLPFTTSNAAIKVFRHALSLDERRSKFQPNVYHRPAPSKKAAELDPEHATPMPTQVDTICPPSKPSEPETIWKKTMRRLGRHPSKAGPPSKEKPPPIATELAPTVNCDVNETWFAGGHSDVGGGAVDNSVVHSLSDIPLRWMIRQVVLSQVGILFDPEALVRADIDIAAISQFVQAAPVASSPSSLGGHVQTKLDAFTAKKHPRDSVESSITDQGQDSLQPIHDAVKNPIWWILEVVPMRYSWQDTDGTWHRKWGINFGKGREVHSTNPRFHVSVKERMDDPELNYVPKAKWAKGSEVYVE